MASSYPHNPCISPRWRLPPPCELRLNFDGSALGNPGVVGFEGVIHNEEEFILLSYSAPAKEKKMGLGTRLAQGLIRVESGESHGTWLSRAKSGESQFKIKIVGQGYWGLLF